MLKDHPLLPIYFYVNKHLVKPEVQGWYDNVMNVVYSRDLSLRAPGPVRSATTCRCRTRRKSSRGDHRW